MSTDIYKIAEFVESIKSNYIDIPEETLALGVFGFMSSMFNNLIENTATMSAEYAYEAIPSKAKFERNIISHALANGINKIFASPAEIETIMYLPEDIIVQNMNNGTFILDKEVQYTIGESKSYPYLLDYDIILRRDKLTNGKYAYTAKYDITGKNQASDIVNPYLPAIETVDLEGEKVIVLKTTIRQLVHTEVYKKIITSNPLDNKVLTFEFSDQLAFFYVEVVENGVEHYLVPVYEGLYDNLANEYINYSFLDESSIRLIFNNDSFTPRGNADVTIHIYTTKGAECNFELDSYSRLQQLKSNRFVYNFSPWVLIESLSDSHYGTDRLNIKQLKQLIPKESLSRGIVSTYTDLNNTFNAIQTDNCKMYFLEKVHNQINRLFYAYLLLKDGDNIVPTNTITASISKAVMSSVSTNAYVIKPGSAFYADPFTGETTGISKPSTAQATEYDKISFLYMCPYLMVINKSPLYVAYYLTLLNYSRYLYFEYVNDESTLQFITLTYTFYRQQFSDPDTYNIEVLAAQNIDSDFQLVLYGADNQITQCYLKAFLVFYTTNTSGNEVATRYCEGELLEIDDSSMTYHFVFKFRTNDQITDKENYLNITSGLKTIGTGTDSSYSIAPNMKAKIFYLAKLSTPPAKGRVYGDNEEFDLDELIPGLSEYTLTNVYSTGSEGMDIFYDYSDINYSYVGLQNNAETNSVDFIVHKIPVVRYTYLDSPLRTEIENEAKIQFVLQNIDRKRKYIQNSLLLLENSFGIDYKFFNTYGPSLLYNIDNATNVDRINLSLYFEVKFQIASEKSYLPLITNSIKEYIEDMNYITDLHMPNLITYITNLYREQLVYIKFLRLNNYGSLHQSVYKNPNIDKDYFTDTQTVPEFINVNTLANGNADISFKIVE